MSQSIKVKTDNYNFKFRVSGLIINENKILMVDMDKSGFLCLPGGYVELGETTEEAIIREIKEETLVDFSILKYLGVVENYFINKYSKKIHEISVYYLLQFNNNISKEDFSLIENDNGYIINHDFKWIEIDEIEKYDIRPNFLKKLLLNNNLEFNHLIFCEVKK